jgi:hypothetical protein
MAILLTTFAHFCLSSTYCLQRKEYTIQPQQHQEQHTQRRNTSSNTNRSGTTTASATSLSTISKTNNSSINAVVLQVTTSAGPTSTSISTNTSTTSSLVSICGLSMLLSSLRYWLRIANRCQSILPTLHAHISKAINLTAFGSVTASRTYPVILG